MEHLDRKEGAQQHQSPFQPAENGPQDEFFETYHYQFRDENNLPEQSALADKDDEVWQIIPNTGKFGGGGYLDEFENNGEIEPDNKKSYA